LLCKAGNSTEEGAQKLYPLTQHRSKNLAEIRHTRTQTHTLTPPPVKYNCTWAGKWLPGIRGIGDNWRQEGESGPKGRKPFCQGSSTGWLASSQGRDGMMQQAKNHPPSERPRSKLSCMRM